MVKESFTSLFLFLFNLYHDTYDSARSLILSCIYIFCSYLHTVNTHQLIYAECNYKDKIIDITTTLRFYYYFDQTLSFASMQSWLRKCDITINNDNINEVKIIFTRNNELFISNLDLDNDIELNTKESCCDTTLQLLFAKKIE